MRHATSLTRTSRGQNKRTNTDYKKWQRGQSDFLLGHWIRIFLFLKEWENNFGVSFAKIFNYCRLHSALLQKTAALAELGHAQNFRPHSGKLFFTSALLKTIRKYLWIYFYFFLIFGHFSFIIIIIVIVVIINIVIKINIIISRKFCWHKW